MLRARLTLSHLEFVTISGLEQLTGSMPSQDNSWFPSFDVLGRLASQQSRSIGRVGQTR